jgi:broad specificity phosphatase PhoE
MCETSPQGTDRADLALFIREHGPQCLILARHGETEWNASRRLQGQQDTLLNTRGQHQALSAARFLKNIPLIQIHCSTLLRCQATARSIAQENIGGPDLLCSDFLKETALGILEGELIEEQSTAELTRHYQKFSRDEIRYRVPGGENLHDVFARVQRFFAGQTHLLSGQGVHLIVGHRNVNKMILKALVGLTFEEGFQAEHEHQRLYFYFAAQKKLWSCCVGDSPLHFTPGCASSINGSYA